MTNKFIIELTLLWILCLVIKLDNPDIFLGKLEAIFWLGPILILGAITAKFFKH